MARQRTVTVNGVDLAAEVHGDQAEPAIVLLHGAGQNMLAWQDEFVARVVDGGRCVVRFDSRDAGRSASYPVGAPAYDLRDLVADTAALNENLGIGSAHLVGMSQARRSVSSWRWTIRTTSQR